MTQKAFFDGMVYDEQENLVATGFVGSDAQYIVDDDGFLRHIDANIVDRQILAVFIEQLQGNQDLAVNQAMGFLGKDDLFTKAALDSSIANVSEDQILTQGMPEQARHMLAMMGLRITINIHGEIVDINAPAAPENDD
ncbi:MAG: hypothetical protein ACI9EW_000697 [Cellvibrionaceae bacterium]|jgi:hypothetical protein